MTATVALVDDNQSLLRSLSMALEFEGFKVRTFTDPSHALTSLSHTPADIMVLDIKMPRMDGVELLARLRAFKSDVVPVIFLSAKNTEIDQVTGLRVGAEEYVTKPFSQTVLIEKIRALLRFTMKLENNDGNKPITRGKLSLDPARRSCLWNGESIELTRSEFEILRVLSSRSEIVRSRDDLLDAIHNGMDSDTDDVTINSHIKRIRQKFRKVDKGFSSIRTRYGSGYYFKED